MSEVLSSASREILILAILDPEIINHLLTLGYSIMDNLDDSVSQISRFECPKLQVDCLDGMQLYKELTMLLSSFTAAPKGVTDNTKELDALDYIGHRKARCRHPDDPKRMREVHQK